MANTTLGSKAVGSIVNLNFDGAMREFLVVHQGKPSSLYDESCNGTWLLMKACLEYKQWHHSDANDYENSEIHNYLNSIILSRFDADIQAQIKPVKLPYRKGSGTSSTITSGASGILAKIFLLSSYEVGFGGYEYVPADGAKLSRFDEDNGGTAPLNKRIAYLNGSAVSWWLRSPCLEYPTSVWTVGKRGGGYRELCSNSYAVRPALILPSNLLTSDDGTVVTNTAPTTPAGINLPQSIYRGNSVQITWNASTDAENNLEGYVVERSTDGGGKWKQIYQGSATTTKNTVPMGTETVIYRVKAYDIKGLQSGWRTSTQVTVINNNAPGAPADLNVPNTVTCDEALLITWGEASDADGDLSGYILERQVDGNAWTQLYKGTVLTFTDNITKGWKTVAYRVKAYDSYNAFSAYVTSETRTVNNNIAPSISGEDAALGLKTGSFSQAYTVSDAENNIVTVTEYVDNQMIRSYQAVLGQDAAITISRENWLKLTNGNHQLRVTAYDGVATTVRIWTFSKKETVICFQLAAPMETEAAAVKILVSPTWKIDGAAVRMEACNNAFDEAPAWEDITAMLMLKRVYHFTNAAKTADKWGFDIRFTIEKNEGYESEVSITGFGCEK